MMMCHRVSAIESLCTYTLTGLSVQMFDRRRGKLCSAAASINRSLCGFATPYVLHICKGGCFHSCPFHINLLDG